MATEIRYDIKGMAIELEKTRSEMSYPNISPSKDINKIIGECSNLDTLTRIDPIRICEYSVILAHYTLYLSSEVNKLEAKMKWCESNIKNIVGKNLNNVTGFFNEKDSSIRSNEPLAQELDRIRLDAQTKYESFKFISEKIKFISNCLENLGRNKMIQRKYDEH